MSAERATSHRLEPKRTCGHVRSDCGCGSSLLCASIRLDPDAITMLEVMNALVAASQFQFFKYSPTSSQSSAPVVRPT
jgi:hypothetical protein